MLGAMSGSAMVMNSLRGARWMEVYQFPSPAYVARMSASEIPNSSAKWRVWAHGCRTGRLPATEMQKPAVPLDLGAFGEAKCVLDIHAKVADCAFDLRVAEQDLDGPQVASCLVDD